MQSAIQLHPEVAALHAQIHALRDELARAVTYHDELRHTAIPYLEAVYQQALGQRTSLRCTPRSRPSGRSAWSNWPCRQ